MDESMFIVLPPYLARTPTITGLMTAFTEVYTQLTIIKILPRTGDKSIKSTEAVTATGHQVIVDKQLLIHALKDQRPAESAAQQ